MGMSFLYQTTRSFISIPRCMYVLQLTFNLLFYASPDFCRLLIIFANSLDPDQDGQNERNNTNDVVMNSDHKVLRWLESLTSVSIAGGANSACLLALPSCPVSPLPARAPAYPRARPPAACLLRHDLIIVYSCLFVN